MIHAHAKILDNFIEFRLGPIALVALSLASLFLDHVFPLMSIFFLVCLEVVNEVVSISTVILSAVVLLLNFLCESIFIIFYLFAIYLQSVLSVL